jgi:hypothetical protein
VTITSELVSFILLLLGSLGAVWLRIEGIVKAARIDALAAAKDAMLAATTASAKAEVVASALAEHRLHVAEAYVSKVGLREQMGQVMDLLRDVQGDIGHVNERLDRVIDGQSQRRQTGPKAS